MYDTSREGGTDVGRLGEGGGTSGRWAQGKTDSKESGESRVGGRWRSPSRPDRENPESVGQDLHKHIKNPFPKGPLLQVPTSGSRTRGVGPQRYPPTHFLPG